MKALSKRAMLLKKKGVSHVMQELNILCSCAHPFVINLVASFQTKHWLCHLMEFCPRGHFYSLLQSQDKKRLPEDSARFYAAEILSGIEYLHFKGFIYRDMKPENILIAASGHLRLTDFDLSQTVAEASTQASIRADARGIGVSQKVHDEQIIARERAQQHEERIQQAAEADAAAAAPNKSELELEPEPQQQLQQPSAEPSSGGGSAAGPLSSAAAAAGQGAVAARFDSFVGTIEYMAPEVVEKGCSHSFSVDFWVLGVMIYEMLYGVTPFRGACHHIAPHHPTPFSQRQLRPRRRVGVCGPNQPVNTVDGVGFPAEKRLLHAGKDATATFEKILLDPVGFPHPLAAEPRPKLSKSVRELIKALLVKKQSKRLGYTQGAAQVKAHGWFKDVTWDLLRNQEPPVMVRPPNRHGHRFSHTANRRGGCQSGLSARARARVCLPVARSRRPRTSRSAREGSWSRCVKCSSSWTRRR